MIGRSWRGQVWPGKDEEYLAFLRDHVFPQVGSIPGNLGARVLRRLGTDEFLVFTEWADMQSVTAFAGPDPTVAVVEPEARALLAQYDEKVEHFELVLESE